MAVRPATTFIALLTAFSMPGLLYYFYLCQAYQVVPLIALLDPVTTGLVAAVTYHIDLEIEPFGLCELIICSLQNFPVDNHDLHHRKNVQNLDLAYQPPPFALASARSAAARARSAAYLACAATS
jgi:hypothetical protein